MTRKRKRRREHYELVNVSPGLQEVHLASGAVVTCRTAVVAGDAVKWTELPGAQHLPPAQRFRLVAAASPPQVHGHWLPQRVVLDGSKCRYVVDVDLVLHEKPAQHERRVQQWRQTSDVRTLARPATWSRLYVVDGTDRVVHASHVTDLHTLQVTAVTVLPLPSGVGRRGQRALDTSLLLAPKELLRAALDATQWHGVLRPAKRRSDVGELTVGKGSPKPGKKSPQRTPHTRELLAQVRDVHEAAPRGSKIEAVMRHFGFSKRKAEQLIAESQDALHWGVRYERSMQSQKKPKKGSKT